MIRRPLANDSPTASKSTPVTFNPLANDTDVDGTLDGSTVSSY
ncbi:MAG: hypothetical protein R3C28_31250 [Pirellulaceae bacterium]